MARFWDGNNWVCPWCERILPLAEFSMDAYRKRHNKGPGRCRDCDREYARAKTALSATGRYADAPHAEAVILAKETCRTHSWGAGYYTDSDIAAATEEARTRRRKPGLREGTTAERKQNEAVRMITRERKQVEEYRRLDAAAAQRQTTSDDGRASINSIKEGSIAEPAEPAEPADRAAEERKQRIRELRMARRDPDWKPADYTGPT